MPIFSPKLNQQILDKIEKRQLFSEENLRKQSKNSRKLAIRLLDFIAKRTQAQDISRYDRSQLDSRVGILVVGKEALFSLDFTNILGVWCLFRPILLSFTMECYCSHSGHYFIVHFMHLI